MPLREGGPLHSPGRGPRPRLSSPAISAGLGSSLALALSPGWQWRRSCRACASGGPCTALLPCAASRRPRGGRGAARRPSAVAGDADRALRDGADAALPDPGHGTAGRTPGAAPHLGSGCGATGGTRATGAALGRAVLLLPRATWRRDVAERPPALCCRAVPRAQPPRRGRRRARPRAPARDGARQGRRRRPPGEEPLLGPRLRRLQRPGGRLRRPLLRTCAHPRRRPSPPDHRQPHGRVGRRRAAAARRPRRPPPPGCRRAADAPAADWRPCSPLRRCT
mmetsp:Transcript_425/g.1479  ORF Transcript_425/g.1479 Transcript_425/m.1479 type:complete len:280 (-) Transcript_425:742-1581(-)